MAMKRCHRDDLFCWSRFDEARDVDFHSYLWVRDGGNVVVDPLPLSEHDREHLRKLGGVGSVILTNSDHLRDAERIAGDFGARMLGPWGERESFPVECDQWLREGDQVALGLTVLEMNGSKTPGEVALLLDGSTLITGDLVRAVAGGSLTLLPDTKLADPAAALASVERLLPYDRIDAVLVGDGWPVFRDGHARLHDLAVELGVAPAP